MKQWIILQGTALSVYFQPHFLSWKRLIHNELDPAQNFTQNWVLAQAEMQGRVHNCMCCFILTSLFVFSLVQDFVQPTGISGSDPSSFFIHHNGFPMYNIGEGADCFIRPWVCMSLLIWANQDRSATCSQHIVQSFLWFLLSVHWIQPIKSSFSSYCHM